MIFGFISIIDCYIANQHNISWLTGLRRVLLESQSVSVGWQLGLKSPGGFIGTLGHWAAGLPSLSM